MTLSRRDVVKAGLLGGAALAGEFAIAVPAISAVRVNPYPAGEDGTVVALRRALDDAANGVAGSGGRDAKGRTIVRAKAGHRHVLKGTLVVAGGTFLDATDARFVANFPQSGGSRTLVLNWVPSATTGGHAAPGNIKIKGGSWDPTWYYLQGVAKPDFDTAAPAPPLNVITMQHTANVELEDLTIYNVKWWHAIELNAVRAATVRGCKLYGWVPQPELGLWHGEAIQLDLAGTANTWAGAKDNTPCTDIHIIGNDCGPSGSKNGWGTLTGSHTAVDNVRHSRVWIESNTIRDTTWDAITPFATQALYVRNNQITHCTGGIYVRAANTTSGSLTTVEITGNTVGPLAAGTGPHPAPRWGIGVAASTANATINDVLVSGNTAPSFRYHDRQWITFRQPPQTTP